MAAGSRQLAQRTLDVALRQIEIDPENVRAHYFAAIMQLQLGDTESGRSNVETALALRPDDYGTLYNSACFHALAGEPERALDLLERSIATGEGFREWIDHYTDLDSLRDRPRFRALMTRLGPAVSHWPSHRSVAPAYSSVAIGSPPWRPSSPSAIQGIAPGSSPV